MWEVEDPSKIPNPIRRLTIATLFEGLRVREKEGECLLEDIERKMVVSEAARILLWVGITGISAGIMLVLWGLCCLAARRFV